MHVLRAIDVTRSLRHRRNLTRTLQLLAAGCVLSAAGAAWSARGAYQESARGGSEESARGDVKADGGSEKIIDLTQTFDRQTIYWPTDTRGFRLESLAHGRSEGGWFYSANAFCSAEHGGTHIDAPIHFSEQGLAVDQIPLDRLVGPGVVIDVRRQAEADPDYQLGLAELQDHEARHGVIAEGAIVLLRTGWSTRWPDSAAYLGDDTPGDASHLSFPGYGIEAARQLVEARRVAVLGIDTASIDPGNSTTFPVHRAAAARQVANLENLTGLDRLPADGFTVIALPMKIGGGSGGPVRVIAILDDN